MQCLQFTLFGFNLIFWLIGSAMLGLGIWVVVDPGAFEALHIANSAGMNDDVWSAAVYMFIAVGALLFVIGTFGCIGAARAGRGTCFLWLYELTICFVMLAEAAIIILTAVYWNSINDLVAQNMQHSVRYSYVNETSDDGMSTAWNGMQQDWECCGSYNHKDYEHSKYDNASIYTVPNTCCNTNDAGDIVKCQFGVQEYIYPLGCYYALVDFLNRNSAIIIGVTCGIAALQVFGLLIACCLLRAATRKPKEQED